MNCLVGRVESIDAKFQIADHLVLWERYTILRVIVEERRDKLARLEIRMAHKDVH